LTSFGGLLKTGTCTVRGAYTNSVHRTAFIEQHSSNSVSPIKTGSGALRWWMISAEQFIDN